MIDSGATSNLISKDVVTKYNIPTQPCDPPIKIKAINYALIGSGITHQTITITLYVGLLHQESISLYIVDSPKHEVILGYPWLSPHDPSISWSHGELTHWSTFCINHCFPRIPQPCLTTSIKSSTPTDLWSSPPVKITYKRSSVKPKPHSYLRTDPGTVLLNFYLMLQYLLCNHKCIYYI